MTNSENAPAYTRRFWAKSDRNDHRRIHLLEHHMADVGACFEALLNQPTIRQRLARSGGSDSLDAATAARLALFAALHDIGKVNTGFQTQIWRDADLPTGRRPAAFRGIGHTRDLTPVLQRKDARAAEWFYPAIGWDELLGWDKEGGKTVCGLFVAALSHHGTPLRLDDPAKDANPSVWRPCGGLVPQEYVERIGRLVREWFPNAFACDVRPLPSAPPFQHMFLGLCTLADWIGSNEEWFPYCDEPGEDYMIKARRKAQDAVKAIGLDLRAQRGHFDRAPGFDALFPQIGQSPNSIQYAVHDVTLDEHLVIIESETGSGKTEAALWRFARMYERGLVDGLYFALPTRAAATQLHDRATRFVERMFSAGDRPETVLAVPGYLRAGDAAGSRLQDYEVWWEDNPDDAARRRRWAAESAKRYLAAQIAVGTIDQAMMAVLKVKHAHMRAACLVRNLLVVDEVHASDVYMRRIVKALLDAHLGAGGYALLMSATLGSAARRQWLSTGRLNINDAPPLDEAVNAWYPTVSTRGPDGENSARVGGNNREKTVAVSAEPFMRNFDRVAEQALLAARAGAKVLVIRNTVGYAVDTQRAVEREATGSDCVLLFACNNIPTLHHGRFAATDRRLLDASVEARLGKERTPGGAIVIGTQTLEQSLDIDADLLITDLCPADVLLQRIGRLHRHTRDDRPSGYMKPACTVLMPLDGDLSPLLQRRNDRNGLGPDGYVYKDLRTLEATRRLIAEYSEWRIPVMNRLLVEHATHPNALEAIVQELGGNWPEHANRIKGESLVEGQTAGSEMFG